MEDISHLPLWLQQTAIAYMSAPIFAIPVKTLLNLGLKNTESIHYQKSPEELVQDTLKLKEGVLK